MAQYADTTGVGGNISANLAGAFRGKRNWIVKSLFLRDLLNRSRDHAGFHAQGPVYRVELQDPAHPVK